MSVNKVIVVGRLGRDPEQKPTRGKAPITSMSVATSRKFKDGTGAYQETTEWHKVVAFGRQAEYASQYLTKGRLVYVEGRLRTSTWEAKDGSKRSTTEIVANNIQGLDRGVDASPRSSSFGGQGASSGYGSSNEPDVAPSSGGLLFDDDDIPF